MKVITVVAGIIVRDEKILCMQRGDGKYGYISGKFEFPGGKVEDGEEYHEALKRELQEEMDLHLDISSDQFYMTVDHAYPDFRIILHSYLLKGNTEKFRLNEHIDFRWMEKENLLGLNWAPADIPIVEKLMKEIF